MATLLLVGSTRVSRLESRVWGDGDATDRDLVPRREGEFGWSQRRPSQKREWEAGGGHGERGGGVDSFWSVGHRPSDKTWSLITKDLMRFALFS